MDLKYLPLIFKIVITPNKNKEYDSTFPSLPSQKLSVSPTSPLRHALIHSSKRYVDLAIGTKGSVVHLILVRSIHVAEIKYAFKDDAVWED